MPSERRALERVGIELPAKYKVKEMFKDEEFPCTMIDITDDGAGIRTETEDTPFGTKPKGGLKTGLHFHLAVDGMDVLCKVIYVEMSTVGIKFEKIPAEQLEIIKKKMNFI